MTKNVNKIKKEIDFESDKDLKNTEAHLKAVAKSKFHFFSK